MKIGIIGPTGFSGSHVALELLNRGHDVWGFSRHPEKLGKTERYTPVPLAIETAPIDELVSAFEGLHVLVNAYNPSPGVNVYSRAEPFLETTRRLLLAVKAITAKSREDPPLYLISIGGTASLSLPSSTFFTAADSRPFWLAYRRSTADSANATAHMVERLGPSSPISASMLAYRNARLALKAGTATPEDMTTIKETEGPVLYGDGSPAPDVPLAARAAFMMFDSVPEKVMTWSFVSPPARFRPGPRTGKYDIWIDELPLGQRSTGATDRDRTTASVGANTAEKAQEVERESEDANEFEDRLLGVSAADLAVAIADEAEKRALVGKHWSPVSEWEGDEVYETLVRW